MKRGLALLLALLLAMPAFAALAEEDDTDGALGLVSYEWFRNPMKVTAADFGVKKGVKFPVYGAPSEDAWRGAKGKAAVSTAETFRLLGWDDDKEWLLIEYDAAGNEKRIGWIRQPCKALEKVHRYTPNFTRNLLRATAKVRLTDDPNGGRRTIAVLSPGDTVIGLCAVGNWICVETEIGGKPVWAFCRPSGLEEVPLWHIKGRSLYVHEGVTMFGEYMLAQGTDEYGNPDWNTVDPPMGTVLDGSHSDSLNELEAIVLPAGLKYIGGSAIGPCRLAKVTIPAGCQVSIGDVAYGTTIGELEIPADVTDVSGFYRSEYTTIGRYTVAEGNPALKSVDGVLFSADGKTLIRYPNGRPGEHYDVPAGTEVIADRAFDDDDVDIPLKTVSLPMGLKSIGYCAFSGCGRLMGVTVPLTVTELSERAFWGCVSLEQLSLPPGLSIEMDKETGSGDYGRYHGDNGRTGGDTDVSEDISWDAYLDNPEGRGEVTLYADAGCTEPLLTMRAGRYVRVTGCSRGAYELYLGYENGEKYSEAWIPMDGIRPVTGNTFFEISSAAILPGAEPVETDLLSDGPPDLSHPEEWTYCGWWDAVGGSLDFTRSVMVEEDGYLYAEAEILTFRIGDVLPKRARTGDSRTLGVLLADSEEEPVWLFEAPEGNGAGHVWPGEQAEALETRDGWVLVRLAAGRFWVRAGSFLTVEQE